MHLRRFPLLEIPAMSSGARRDGVETVWFALGVKMATTAAIVVTACLLVERCGPLIGGVVATLPVSAGPAYAFLAAEHGAGFIAASAPASLASIGATAGFVTVYGALARTRGRGLSTLGALVVWAGMTTVLRAAAPGLWTAAATDVVVFGAAMRIVAAWRRAPLRGAVRSSAWDIPVRAGAAMLVVAAVLAAGRLLGPGAAGALALAPVVLTSLAVLLHPRIGGPAAAAVMANTVPGLMGFGAATLAIGLTAQSLGATLSLLLALAISLGWNAGILLLARARARR
jgi:hypothetical protein